MLDLWNIQFLKISQIQASLVLFFMESKIAGLVSIKVTFKGATDYFSECEKSLQN